MCHGESPLSEKSQQGAAKYMLQHTTERSCSKVEQVARCSSTQ